MDVLTTTILTFYDTIWKYKLGNLVDPFFSDLFPQQPLFPQLQGQNNQVVKLSFKQS